MNKSKKIVQIEGLRGLAMVMVVCSHYIARFIKDYCTDYYLHDFFGIIYWGEIGVTVFFLISGFFIIPSQKVTKAAYLKKRFLKIWPMYMMAIAICFIITHLFYLPNRTVTFSDYLLNVPFLNGFLGKPYVDQAHWYLTIIVSATVIFAVIKDLSVDTRHFFYWCWCIAVFILYKYESANAVLHLIRSGLFVVLGKDYAPVIILGATLADIWNQRIGKKAAITILLCYTIKAITSTKSKSAELLLVSIIFIMVLYDKIPLFKSRLMLFLGNISLYVYLIHQNIGYLIMLTIIKALGEYHVWISLLMIPIAIGMGICLQKFDVIIRKKLNS